MLQKHEIDLAITELEGKPAAGLGSAILFKLPLVLILPRRLRVRNAAEMWRGGVGAETLISLPPDEVMVKQFQSRLKKLGVHWPCGVEVSALDLVPIYASLGFGVGLSIQIPRAKLAPGLKILPLPNFPPLVFAALWQKNLSRSNADFLSEIQRRAREIQSEK